MAASLQANVDAARYREALRELHSQQFATACPISACRYYPARSTETQSQTAAAVSGTLV